MTQVTTGRNRCTVLGTLTKWALMQALFTPDSMLAMQDGTPVILQGVAREDGSGDCFNVTVAYLDGHKATLFLRCRS